MNKYNEKVMQNFLNPKNAGVLRGANATNKINNQDQSSMDIVKFYLKINDETEVIEDARFKTCGCTAAIAVSNVACDLLKEKTIEQALLIKDYDIISALGELPLDKIHCAITVTDAIKSAIDNYYERKAKEQKKEEKAKIKAMKNMFNFN